ncbi:flagellar hook-associated protein FlgK [Jiella sp. M17.18]|uniref:flagellar hook-associated protein FlgK n=1 Tax=Jiella sp. M17.18 TaxID=3234247 RepID=UPI0034DE47C0
MSLLSALSNARSSLATVSAQTALVSRNIGNAQNTAATRKYANLSAGAAGGVQVVSIAQSQNHALFQSMTSATGGLAAANAMSDSLTSIQNVVGDVDATTTPSNTLTALQAALSQYAVSPEDPQTARAAIDAAKDVVNSLNNATKAVQSARKDADDQLTAAASDMNDILSQFQALNDGIVKGTATGSDVTDLVDQRDQLVTKLSGYVGVNVQVRSGNDMVLTTDSGITLFETTARSVEFTPQTAYDATVTGSPFKIDGVSVSGANSAMPIKSGSVYGLLTFRDETAVTYQGQLDQIASTLVDDFSESGTYNAQTGSFDPATGTSASPIQKFQGLFNVALGSTVGAAGSISVDPAFDNDPTLLRDGQTVDYNTTNSSGFTGRLNQLISAFSTQRSFDGSLGAGSQGSIISYAGSSTAWLQAQRSAAKDDIDYQSTLLSGTKSALSDKTGVNLDEEMTNLLDLERSYQASSKIISTIGNMVDSLLNIR